MANVDIWLSESVILANLTRRIDRDATKERLAQRFAASFRIDFPTRSIEVRWVDTLAGIQGMDASDPVVVSGDLISCNEAQQTERGVRQMLVNMTPASWQVKRDEVTA